MVPMAGLIAVMGRDDTLLGERNHASTSQHSLSQSGQEEGEDKVNDAIDSEENPAESGKKGNPPLVSQRTNVGTPAVSNATTTELEDHYMDTFSQPEEGRVEEEKDTDPMDNLDGSGRIGNSLLLGTHWASAGTSGWNNATAPMLDDSHMDPSRLPGQEEGQEMEDITEDITNVSGRGGTIPWEIHGTIPISPDENLHPTSQVEDDPMDTSNFHARNNRVPENCNNLQLRQNAANGSVSENNNNFQFGQHDANDLVPENNNDHQFGQHDANDLVPENNNDHQFRYLDIIDPEPEFHNEFQDPEEENNNDHQFVHDAYDPEAENNNDHQFVHDANYPVPENNDDHHFGQFDINEPEPEFYNLVLMEDLEVYEPMPGYYNNAVISDIV